MLPSYQKVSIISVDLLKRLSLRQVPDVEMGQEKIPGTAKTQVIFLSFHSIYPSYDFSYSQLMWM